MEGDSVRRFFQDYVEARKAFVKTVADLAEKAEHAPALRQAGALPALGPLLLDAEPLVSQVAALALGRLVKNDAECAGSLCDNPEALGWIVRLLTANTADKAARPNSRKTGLVTLRNLVVACPAAAPHVIDAGVLGSLLLCLEDADVSVREKTLWLFLELVRAMPVAAVPVIWEEGAVPPIIAEYCGPEESLRGVALHALHAIAQHRPKDVFGCFLPKPELFTRQLVRDVKSAAPPLREVAAKVLGLAAGVETLAGAVANAPESLYNNSAYPALAAALQDPVSANARYWAAEALAKAFGTAHGAQKGAQAAISAKDAAQALVDEADKEAHRLRSEAERKEQEAKALLDSAGNDAAKVEEANRAVASAQRSKDIAENKANLLLSANQEKLQKAQAAEDQVRPVKGFVEGVAKASAKELRDVLKDPTSNARAHALVALGYAAEVQSIAKEIVSDGGASALAQALQDPADFVQAAAAKAVTQLAQSGATGALCAAGVLERLVLGNWATPEVAKIAEAAWPALIRKCESTQDLRRVLEPDGVRPAVVEAVLERLKTLLETNEKAQNDFALGGGLGALHKRKQCSATASELVGTITSLVSDRRVGDMVEGRDTAL